MSGLFLTEFRDFYQQVANYSENLDNSIETCIRFTREKFIITSNSKNVKCIYIFKNRLCYVKSWFPFESYILSILNSKEEIINDNLITNGKYESGILCINLDEIELEEFSTTASRIETIKYFKHFETSGGYILANGYYWFYMPYDNYRQFIVFTEKNFKLVGFSAPIYYQSTNSEITISDRIYIGEKTIEFSELLNNFIYHNTTIKSDTNRIYNLKDQFHYDLITKPFYQTPEIVVETIIKPPIIINGFDLERYLCLLPNKNLVKISKTSSDILYSNGLLQTNGKEIKPLDNQIYSLPGEKTVYDILKFYSRASDIGNKVKEVVLTMATKSDFLTTNSKDIIEIGERLDTKTQFCEYTSDNEIKLDFENSEFLVMNSKTIEQLNDTLVNYCISNGIIMFVSKIPKKYKDLEQLYMIEYNESMIDWESLESIEKWMGFMAGIHDNIYNGRLPHMMEEYLRIAKSKNPLITLFDNEKHYFP